MQTIPFKIGDVVYAVPQIRFGALERCWPSFDEILNQTRAELRAIAEATAAGAPAPDPSPGEGIRSINALLKVIAEGLAQAARVDARNAVREGRPPAPTIVNLSLGDMDAVVDDVIGFLKDELDNGETEALHASMFQLMVLSEVIRPGEIRPAGVTDQAADEAANPSTAISTQSEPS